MDDKHHAGRRPSGSGEKQKGKSSNKKKRKNKTKERERKRSSGSTGKTKPYNSDETNSDSALDWAKKHAKEKKSHSSDGRTKYSNSKNSVSALQNSTGVSSAPALGSRNSTSSRVSLLDRQGLQDIYALFTSQSEPNKIRASTSQSSADSEISEIAEMVDESLRWNNMQSDAEDEAERIRVYKMNRRKRYLADAYQKREDKEGVLKLARDIAACNSDDR